jgi:XRE family aerobic/anaerobic benzoate catabolism transcriptional regulator
MAVELARALNLKFLELDDAVVERSGLSLSALFALHGEAYYRQVEHQCLVEVLAREEPLVLATGGGVVEHLESYDLLLRHTVTVWLDARADRLWERVVGQGDERPMKGRATALAQLNLLLERRRPLYSRALLHVETSDIPAARLTGDLVEQIQLLKADVGQSEVRSTNPL